MRKILLFCALLSVLPLEMSAEPMSGDKAAIASDKEAYRFSIDPAGKGRPGYVLRIVYQALPTEEAITVAHDKNQGKRLLAALGRFEKFSTRPEKHTTKESEFRLAAIGSAEYYYICKPTGERMLGIRMYEGSRSGHFRIGHDGVQDLKKLLLELTAE